MALLLIDERKIVSAWQGIEPRLRAAHQGVDCRAIHPSGENHVRESSRRAPVLFQAFALTAKHKAHRNAARFKQPRGINGVHEVELARKAAEIADREWTAFVNAESVPSPVGRVNRFGRRRFGGVPERKGAVERCSAAASPRHAPVDKSVGDSGDSRGLRARAARLAKHGLQQRARKRTHRNGSGVDEDIGPHVAHIEHDRYSVPRTEIGAGGGEINPEGSAADDPDPAVIHTGRLVPLRG